MSRGVVVFSDLHVHNYKQYRVQNGVSRIEWTLRVIDDVFDTAKKLGIKDALFPGDLYDKIGTLPTVVVNAVVRRLNDNHKEYPMKWWTVSGNHDQSSQHTISSPGETALDHLGEAFEWFHVLDDKSVDIGDEVYLHGLPYYEYPEDFHTRLNELVPRVAAIQKEQPDSLHYLLMHQTPRGIIDDSLPWDTDPMLTHYSYFDYIFCGHIHRYQKLTENFVMVGNPLQRDKGDKGQEKGFLLFDLYFPDKGHKFVTRKGKYPEFIEVAYEDREEVPDVTDDYYDVLPPILVTSRGKASDKQKEFKITTNAEDLMRSYWEQEGEGDEELLSVGFECI
jgi:DNA repair exonuclease SbcCD nuclease subunit